jgi:branched-chain amino acid transport system ATP-binding protein
MIRVTDLTVRFGGVTAIDHLSVEFPDGTCGLVGPNGAGKSTFFNAISGFVRPQSGRVELNGEDLLALPDFRRVRRGVRRTFQQEQSIAELSVFDNVLLSYEHSGRIGHRRQRDNIMDALAFTGLDAVAWRRVGGLPARERRLTEIARAIAGRPAAVLLDEPAAGLPEPESRHIGQIIRRIPAELGAQVVLVDHDMDLVSSSCTNLVVIDFGRLVAAGDTPSVLKDERVLAAYIGTEDSVA